MYFLIIQSGTQTEYYKMSQIGNTFMNCNKIYCSNNLLAVRWVSDLPNSNYYQSKLMKRYQIANKKYTAQYKQIRKIHSDQLLQTKIMRNITNKKKVIAYQTLIHQETDGNQILKHIHNHWNVFECTTISKFIGFVILNSNEIKKKEKDKKYIALLYEYCESDLNTTIQNINKNGSKEDRATLIWTIYRCLMETMIKLEDKSMFNLNYLVLDPHFISLNHLGLINEQIKLLYLPFHFIQQNRISQKDFKNSIYTAKELRIINREESKPINHICLGVSQIIEESQRQTEHLEQNKEMIQKLGLFMLKLLYMLSQQIQLVEKFNLYTMNEQFNIDFNWNLIKQFITQCNHYKEYSLIAEIIKFMIIDCKEQKTFKQYAHQIHQISIKQTQHISNRSKLHKTNQINQQQQQPTERRRIVSNSQYYAEGSKKNFQLRLAQIQNIILTNRIYEQIKYNDGSVYKGQINAGQRQGYGIYKFPEGQIYGGQWKNNDMNGKGIYLFKDNQSYEGEVAAGIKEGHGTYKYANGNQYCGHWQNDLKEGFGQFYCAVSGQKYKGQFKDNHKDGRGVIIYPTKQKFEGSFKRGLKNGQGSVYDSKGKLYLRGYWLNDQIQDSGEIYLPNGDSYVGKIRNSKMNGWGIYKYINGTIYEGEFVNNEQNGSCTIRYTCGDYYEGQVKKGLFDGRGKYFYNGVGLVYAGEWVNGIQQGIGQYIYQNNVKVNGVLRKGEILSFSINSIEQPLS